jgi:hypothetical protein
VPGSPGRSYPYAPNGLSQIVGTDKICLDKRLGLHIAPSEVRLQPSQDDGYAWSITDHSAHLLQGSLSNGSVGRYDAICAELGVSIEAVRPEVLGDNGPTYLGEDDVSPRDPRVGCCASPRLCHDLNSNMTLGAFSWRRVFHCRHPAAKPREREAQERDWSYPAPCGNHVSYM